MTKELRRESDCGAGCSAARRGVAPPRRSAGRRGCAGATCWRSPCPKKRVEPPRRAPFSRRASPAAKGDRVRSLGGEGQEEVLEVLLLLVLGGLEPLDVGLVLLDLGLLLVELGQVTLV